MRLSAEIGADANLFTTFGPATILSPDGTRLAFVASDPDEERRIYAKDQVAFLKNLTPHKQELGVAGIKALSRNSSRVIASQCLT